MPKQSLPSSVNVNGLQDPTALKSTGDNDLEMQLARLRASTKDLLTITEELKQFHASPEEYWYAIGSRLQRIVSERLYRTGGYASFSDYCARGLGYSRQHAYKLIKVVRFIDELWAQAKTAEQRSVVRRLFILGFTKLYSLHSLPGAILENLLEHGVALPSSNGQPERKIVLEMATVGQLKRVLAQERDSKQDRPSSAFTRPVATSALTTLISVQAKTLLRFIEQCQGEFSNQEGFSERLEIMKQYASAIVQGISALNGDGALASRPARATALVVDADEELSTLIQEALATVSINALHARTSEEAQKNFIGGFDLLITRPSNPD